MVGSVERIKQDLAEMDRAIGTMANEFHSAYSNYLNGLGQAVRQQLILASYHVCTQGYPERFLALSYNQREQLQQTLRDLANQTQEELLAQLHFPIVPELPESVEMVDQSELFQEPTASTTIYPTVSPKKDEQAPQLLAPIHLVQWQQDLEASIVQELQTASHAANRLLQQAGVLPRKLPEPVLEVATKADPSEVGGNTPNLISLLVEAPGEIIAEQERIEEAKGHSVVHVVAIHLRLSEIEFTNAALTAARTHIRSLLARLKILGRDYQKKQREQAIAEAQAAWRSSWTDD